MFAAIGSVALVVLACCVAVPHAIYLFFMFQLSLIGAATRSMAQKRNNPAPSAESSRELLLRVLGSDEFRAGRLLSLETLEVRCGVRLRQIRRAEMCLGTFDVVRVAQLEFDLAVAPEVARSWLAVCGSAAPSATGRILNEK